MSGRHEAHAEYYDSGLDWLGSIPRSWELERLGSYFQERRTKVSDVDYSALSVTMQGIVPQLETAAKTNDGDNRKLVRAGDFVINSRSDRKGSSGISPFDGSVSLISIVLRPGNIHLPFVHHLLRSTAFQEEFYRFGKGIVADLWSTNYAAMKNIIIPVMPREEQTQIAKFLDYETAKMDALIEKQQQLIAFLKEKRQAVISHAVTKGLNPDALMRDSGVEWLGEVPAHWIVRELKQSVESGSSISYGIVQPGEPLEEGIPFVQTTNISRGSFDLEALQRTTAEIAAAFPRSRLSGGEVILGIRASIGAAYVVPSHLRGCNLSRGVARIRPATDLSATFLVWYLRSQTVAHYWGLCSQGSTFSEVSIDTVKKLYLAIPGAEAQAEICRFLELKTSRLDELIVAAESQSSLLQERRTALISAAVTGKIDVREWKASGLAMNLEVAS